MIGTLITSKLPASLATGPSVSVSAVMLPQPSPPLSSVLVTGNYAAVPPPPPPAIVASGALPTELVAAPALPPTPAARPVVQSMTTIPALPPSAVMTTLAPSYGATGAGVSVIANEPPNDARLPAPLPFASVAGASPILASVPDAFGAPVATTATTAAAVTASNASSSAPSWMWAAAGVAGLALVGGVAFALKRKRGRR